MLSQQKMRIFEGPFGPVYGSGEGREKKKNLPNVAPGAPFIGGQGGPKRAHILVATNVRNHNGV